MDRIEKTLLLRDVDLFCEAQSSSLALLSSVAQVVDLESGATLVHGVESDPSLFVVVRGQVELAGAEGGERRLGERDSFGARGLLAGEPEELEVRSDDRSRLLRIARSDFRDLLVENPELALDVGKALAGRLGAART